MPVNMCMPKHDLMLVLEHFTMYTMKSNCIIKYCKESLIAPILVPLRNPPQSNAIAISLVKTADIGELAEQ